MLFGLLMPATACCMQCKICAVRGGHICFAPITHHKVNSCRAPQVWNIRVFASMPVPDKKLSCNAPMRSSNFHLRPPSVSFVPSAPKCISRFPVLRPPGHRPYKLWHPVEMLEQVRMITLFCECLLCTGLFYSASKQNVQWTRVGKLQAP